MSAEWVMATKNAISEVMETMFFILVRFDGEGVPAAPYPFGSYIELTGDTGAIGLGFCAAEGFSRSITANFLGIDEQDVQREDIEDTVKELANMVGGKVMESTPESNWQLRIPRLIAPGGEAPRGKRSEVELHYGGERVGVVLIDVDGPARTGCVL